MRAIYVLITFMIIHPSYGSQVLESVNDRLKSSDNSDSCKKEVITATRSKLAMEIELRKMSDKVKELNRLLVETSSEKKELEEDLKKTEAENSELSKKMDTLEEKNLELSDRILKIKTYLN